MLTNGTMLRHAFAGILIACVGHARAQMLDPEPAGAAQPVIAPVVEPVVEPAERPANRPAPGRDGAQPNADRPARHPALDRIANPPAARGAPAEPTVSFGAFAEPMQLTTLIDFVGTTLNINIVVKGSPAGEVVFNAPIAVPRSRLLDLLDAMLEQYGFTVTQESLTGFYIVQPATEVRPTVGGERSSVRIIPTPNIKPSQIAATLGTIVGVGGGASSIQAVDELGVLMVHASARDIGRVEALVGELMRIDSEQQYIRLELNHIAAPAALERAVGLVGSSSAAGATGGIPGNAGRQVNRANPEPGLTLNIGAAPGTFSNLADRITVDPQGNALIFRGTPDEIARVRSILAVIDVPNKLQPKSYFAGSAAATVADIASRRGLGEVVQVTDTNNQNTQLNPFLRAQQNNQQLAGASSSQTSIGGPVMVVDVGRGNIIYYGTGEQQQQLADLMQELRTEDERVVLRNYVLNNSDAQTVADLVTSIVTGQQQTADAPLLPGQGGFGQRTGTGSVQLFQGFPGDTGSGDVSAAFDPDVVTITADIDNNQVIVKAPVKQQDELERLIERLDRRRAQVYIQAMIVSVSDNEDFTLAFETQLQAGEFGLNTAFGLGGFGTGAFTDPKSVSTSLGGLTAAVIRSEYVPIIINATQTNTDIRILSSPQILVNDNEEAEIVSIEEQPFTTTNVGQTTDTTTFGGFAEAGTTLTVTPSISDGGFLRLDYYVELSNFTAATGIDGNPPPRNTRRVQGKATIPSDATIVVGGLTVDDIRDTVVKVPLLGDIPLVGELFKRTNKVNNRAKLYVFLTPRIMTDPDFNDLKLLTQGPQTDVGVDPDAPPLETESIRSTPGAARSPVTDGVTEGATERTPALTPADID